MKVQFIKAWETNEGEQFEPGDVISATEALGFELVERGIARKHEAPDLETKE